MRLGAYRGSRPAKGSKIAEIYGSTDISERHRHRYEVNIDYGPARKAAWFRRHVARRRAARDGRSADHPWFIGVQYHPELKSRPFEPHPLFASFIGPHAATWVTPSRRSRF
jgi:CTP synthase